MDQAVSDGVITKEQESELLQKQKEFRLQMQQLRDKHQEDMKKWLEEQKIDSSKLQEYAFDHGHGKWNHESE